MDPRQARRRIKYISTRELVLESSFRQVDASENTLKRAKMGGLERLRGGLWRISVFPEPGFQG